MRIANRTATYELWGGVQYIYRFPNGWGASVICHRGSYGGPEGLWEVGVMAPAGELNGEPTGWLTVEEVHEKLNEIEAY